MSILHTPHGEAIPGANFSAAQGVVVEAESSGESFAVTGRREGPEARKLAEHEGNTVSIPASTGGQGAATDQTQPSCDG